ncbi:MAG TPA: GAF domain-containing protein [Solirubrobacteraceae bacterium]|nr:GAF domain-containing protein [Solirubrobacteraceae bacterium]
MSESSLIAIADRLLATTGASRTTIRLDRPDAVFPIVAESVAPGVPSLLGGRGVGDLRAAKTFQWLDRERRVLVQDELERADPAPPAELIQAYGAKAQMLAPVLEGERLAGIVSVHQSGGPRAWTDADVQAIEQAAQDVLRELGEGGLIRDRRTR